MRICHLASGDLWAGAEVQAYTMLRSLATQPSLEISAVILNEGILAQRLREAGITVNICDESKHSFTELYRAIKQIMPPEPVDIIHSHRIKENVLAGLLRRSGKARRLVATIHGIPEAKVLNARLKLMVQGRVEAFMFRKYFDRLLPVSNDIYGTMVKRFGSAKVRTVHNAIDLGRTKINRPPDEIKRELGIEADQMVVGTAGRMVPVKGYDQFLQSAKLILESEPQAVFVIAGDGPLLGELKGLASQMGISRRIIFTGFREDVVDIINCFDIFLISSQHEGIPMVVLEAMALGKTVVAFEVGGLKEIIEHGRSGLLVAGGDPSALAKACLDIWGDDVRRNKIQSAAVERVTNAFSTDTQRKQLLNIYDEVLDAHSASSNY